MRLWVIACACFSLPLVISQQDQEQKVDANTLLSYLQSNTTQVSVQVSFNLDYQSLLLLISKHELQEKNLRNLTETLQLVEESVHKLARTLPTSQLDLTILGGKKYFFSKKNAQVTWMDAVSYCRMYGMQLVSVETKVENDLLVGHITAMGLADSWVWMSGNRMGRTTWTWLTGEQVTFFDWASGEPNNLHSELGMLYWNSKWHSGACSSACHFICEEI